MSDNDKTQTAAGEAPKQKTKISTDVIDAALRRAKEKQAEKAAEKEGAAKEPKAAKVKAEKPAKEPKAAKVKAEKPAKEPKAKKEPKPKVEKGPAHLKKVESAASSLPALSDEAKAAFDRIDSTVGFTATELNALAAHIGHKARVMMTSAAISTAKPEVGATVKITSGDKGAAKYVGMSGVLVECRNIRCFVDVHDADGKVIKKGLYLYTSDVTVTAPAPKKADPAPAEKPADPPAQEPAPAEKPADPPAQEPEAAEPAAVPLPEPTPAESPVDAVPPTA